MFQPVESDEESHHSYFIDSSDSSAISGESDADLAELCINCGAMGNCECDQNNPADFFIVAAEAAAAVNLQMVQFVGGSQNDVSDPDNGA
jgi:hypothetical protein